MRIRSISSHEHYHYLYYYFPYYCKIKKWNCHYHIYFHFISMTFGTRSRPASLSGLKTEVQFLKMFFQIFQGNKKNQMVLMIRTCHFNSLVKMWKHLILNKVKMIKLRDTEKKMTTCVLEPPPKVNISCHQFEFSLRSSKTELESNLIFVPYSRSSLWSQTPPPVCRLTERGFNRTAAPDGNSEVWFLFLYFFKQL